MEKALFAPLFFNDLIYENTNFFIISINNELIIARDDSGTTVFKFENRIKEITIG